MGGTPISYAKSINEDSMSYHDVSLIEEEAFRLLELAKEMAMQKLLDEKRVLLVMSGRLANQSRMEKGEIEELFSECMISPFTNESTAFTYRQLLLEQLTLIEEESSAYCIEPTRKSA